MPHSALAMSEQPGCNMFQAWPKCDACSLTAGTLRLSAAIQTFHLGKSLSTFPYLGVCLQESLVHHRAILRAQQVSLHPLLMLLKHPAARTWALGVPKSQPCRNHRRMLPKLVQAAVQVVGSMVSNSSLLPEGAEAHLGLLGISGTVCQSPKGALTQPCMRAPCLRCK